MNEDEVNEPQPNRVNPEPQELRKEANEAADQAEGRVLDDEVRALVDEAQAENPADVPVGDLLNDDVPEPIDEDGRDLPEIAEPAGKELPAAEPSAPDVDVSDIAVPEMPETKASSAPVADVSSVASSPKPSSDKHKGVDPKKIRERMQQKARERRGTSPKPRSPRPIKSTDVYSKDLEAAWDAKQRMDAGLPPDDSEVSVEDLLDEPASLDADQSYRASQRGRRAATADGREVNDQLGDELRATLELEIEFKRSVITMFEQYNAQVRAILGQLEDIKNGFERDREGY